ncbi:hypothetical protein BG015_011790 [Linnemannia schmuckeri]|uniref:Uncharacterized protein n=1 Tax=Linnemannia schmuckeri TaxID=64567 RepID=A0A9P5RS69_9FUNG|nr:hypothetical protein BG015_011790 [Linnemannia schmuckeri]
MIRTATTTTTTAATAAPSAIPAPVPCPTVYVAPARVPPVVTMTNDATPRLVLTNTQGPRKIQCRGLTAKHKNIHANTMTVLSAMIHSPPFVTTSRKRVAWESVAQLCQVRNADLCTVSGILCEKRYELVRDEYKRAQAAHRAASGQDEPPATEQDDVLEELISMEEAFDAEEAASQERAIRLRAEENYFRALGEDKRNAACARALQARNNTPVANRATSEQPAVEEAEILEMTAGHVDVPTDAGTGGPRKRRKRRGQDDEELNALFKTSAHFFQLVAEKYLSKNKSI